MKHLKPYNIFESVTSDESNDEIMDVLSHVVDHGYDIRIFDAYCYTDENLDCPKLSTKISSIQKKSKKSKLISISNGNNTSGPFTIDNYKTMFRQATSGIFYFNNDFSKYKEFFLDLMDSISQFSERNPRLCISDIDNIVILLEYGLVSDEEIQMKKTIDDMYNKLKIVLSNIKAVDYSPEYGKKNMYNISHWVPGELVGVSPMGDEGSIYVYKIISTLCYQLKGTQGYGWMDRVGYEPIVDNPDLNAMLDVLKNEDLEVAYNTSTVNGQYNDDVNFIILPKKA